MKREINATIAAITTNYYYDDYYPYCYCYCHCYHYHCYSYTSSSYCNNYCQNPLA